MNQEEFQEYVGELLEENRLTEHQANDLIAQREQFDERRGGFEVEYRGQVVGLLAGDVMVRENVRTLLDDARAAREEGGIEELMYFEPIGGALLEVHDVG